MEDNLIFLPGLSEHQSHLLSQLASLAEKLAPYCDGSTTLSQIASKVDIGSEEWNNLRQCVECGLGDIKLVSQISNHAYWKGIDLGSVSCIAFTDSNGNLGVACYGTDDAWDTIDDIWSGITGGESSQVNLIRNWYKNLLNMFPSSEVYLYGHSHGGLIALMLYFFNKSIVKKISLLNSQLPSKVLHNLTDEDKSKITSTRVFGMNPFNWLTTLASGGTDVSYERVVNSPDGEEHGYNPNTYGSDGYAGCQLIHVNTSTLRWVGSKLHGLSKQLQSIYDDACKSHEQSISSGEKIEDPSVPQLDIAFLLGYKGNLDRLAGGLDFISTKWEEAENNVCGHLDWGFAYND